MPKGDCDDDILGENSDNAGCSWRDSHCSSRHPAYGSPEGRSGKTGKSEAQSIFELKSLQVGDVAAAMLSELKMKGSLSAPQVFHFLPPGAD